MTITYAALCSDFYINQKLELKLDLPSNRETLLDIFDRVKRDLPGMDRFRRYEDELALESADDHSQYSWMAIKQTSLRTGWVNPAVLEDAYRLHQLILEVAPYYLSITPLDVAFLELSYGFDLEAPTNRNEVVFEALCSHGPLSHLVADYEETVLDAQPFIGFSLNEDCSLQCLIEVKTRTRPWEVARGKYENEPISVYLTVRKHGPLQSIEQFATTFGTLAGYAERIAEDRVIPHIVVPIRETLLSHPG